MALCQYVESNNAYYYERVIAVIIVDYNINTIILAYLIVLFGIIRPVLLV